MSGSLRPIHIQLAEQLMGTHEVVGLNSLSHVLFKEGGGCWMFGPAGLTIHLDFYGHGLLIIVGYFVVVLCSYVPEVFSVISVMA